MEAHQSYRCGGPGRVTNMTNRTPLPCWAEGAARQIEDRYKYTGIRSEEIAEILEIIEWHYNYSLTTGNASSERLGVG